MIKEGSLINKTKSLVASLVLASSLVATGCASSYPTYDPPNDPYCGNWQWDGYGWECVSGVSVGHYYFFSSGHIYTYTSRSFAVRAGVVSSTRYTSVSGYSSGSHISSFSSPRTSSSSGSFTTTGKSSGFGSSSSGAS